MQRVYALNDEPALLVCDYTKSGRPKIPFPYYQEAWTGIEYLVAAQFIHAGMLREGLGTLEDVRRRFDGERRNPWDEPECGHHYARAMSAWSSVIAFTGFDYHGVEKAIALAPKSKASAFTSFYSTGLGWGLFSIARRADGSRIELGVTEGSLPLRSIRLDHAAGARTTIMLARTQPRPYSGAPDRWRDDRARRRSRDPGRRKAGRSTVESRPQNVTPAVSRMTRGGCVTVGLRQSGPVSVHSSTSLRRFVRL